IDGTVLGDSQLDVAQVRALENHASRDEIVEAHAQGRGVSRRYSTTVQADMLYVAIPYPDRGAPKGVIRAAIPMADVELASNRLRMMLLLAAGFGLAMAVLMSGIASELMSRALRTLVAGARAVARGEREKLEPLGGDELGGLA